jgi:hypothetical protein
MQLAAEFNKMIIDGLSEFFSTFHGYDAERCYGEGFFELLKIRHRELLVYEKSVRNIIHSCTCFVKINVTKIVVV